MKNYFEHAPTPEKPLFHYEILSDADTRREIKERMEELIEEIKTQNIDVVVFLDRSARPLAWLFKEMWKKERKKMPEIKFVNVGQTTLLHKGSRDILQAEGHTIEEEWSDTINDIIPVKVREGTWIHTTDLPKLWRKGVSEKTDLISELQHAFRSEFDGKKLLILDECAATGLSQLAAVGLFDAAFTEAAEISATQFFQSTHNYKRDLKRLPWLQQTGMAGVLEKREQSMFSVPVTEERLKKLHAAQLEIVEKKDELWKKRNLESARKQWDVSQEEAMRLNAQLRSEMKCLATEQFARKPKKQKRPHIQEQEYWMNWLNNENMPDLAEAEKFDNQEDKLSNIDMSDM